MSAARSSHKKKIRWCLFLAVFAGNVPTKVFEAPEDLLSWSPGRRKGFLDRTPEAVGYQEIIKYRIK